MVFHGTLMTQISLYPNVWRKGLVDRGSQIPSQRKSVPLLISKPCGGLGWTGMEQSPEIGKNRGRCSSLTQLHWDNMCLSHYCLGITYCQSAALSIYQMLILMIALKNICFSTWKVTSYSLMRKVFLVSVVFSFLIYKTVLIISD